MIGEGVFLIGWMIFVGLAQSFPSICCSKKKDLDSKSVNHPKYQKCQRCRDT